jgi:DNA-binding transcriptional MerR regulator
MRGVVKVWKDSYIDTAKKLAMEGQPTGVIAKALGVSRAKLYSWMKEYPALETVINEGRDYFDSKVVEKSLFKRVKGFSVKEVHITKNKDGTTTKKTVKKHYPPDVVACIFWLKNRQPERWKDVREFTVDAADGLEKRLRAAKERQLALDTAREQIEAGAFDDWGDNEKARRGRQEA